MKRATRGVILARLFQFHVFVYDVDNIDAGEQLLNEILRNHVQIIRPCAAQLGVAWIGQ